MGAGGVGHGRGAGVKHLIEGPEDGAIAREANELGPQPDAERGVGVVEREVDEQHGVGRLVAGDALEQDRGQCIHGLDGVAAGEGADERGVDVHDLEAGGGTEGGAQGLDEAAGAFLGEGFQACGRQQGHAQHIDRQFGQTGKVGWLEERPVAPVDGHFGVGGAAGRQQQQQGGDPRANGRTAPKHGRGGRSEEVHETVWKPFIGPTGCEIRTFCVAPLGWRKSLTGASVAEEPVFSALPGRKAHGKAA